MKLRIQLSTIFIAALSISVSAQWTFGIQGGLNQSWHSGADAFNEEGHGSASLKGMAISTPLYRQVNKYLEIGLEPGLVQRGVKEGSDIFSEFIFVNPPSFITSPVISSFYYTGSINTTYIQLPVMAKLQAPLFAGKMSFYIKGGAGFSRLATAYVESGNFGPAGNHKSGIITKVDLKNDGNFRRTDFGLYGGAGISLKAGAGHLAIGTDTYAGFISVKRYGGSQNRSLSYSLGYLIDLQ